MLVLTHPLFVSDSGIDFFLSEYYIISGVYYHPGLLGRKLGFLSISSCGIGHR